MSDREKQNKQDRKSNIDSSMYARVNTGQNANNKFDSPRINHPGGNTDDLDERTQNQDSLFRKILFYVLGGCFSVAFIFMGLWVFRDYFYGNGMNEVLPSLLLLLISVSLGMLSSKLLLKKKKR